MFGATNVLKDILWDAYGYSDIVLTEYGTVFLGNKEYPFEDFEKRLMKHYSSIDDFYLTSIYCKGKKSNGFVLKIYGLNIIIVIPQTQKKLDENPTLNDNIEKLMKIAEIKQLDNRKKQIDSRVEKTGELPSDIEEIKLYTEYLEEQLAKRKEEIAKSCRKLSLATSITPLTAYGLITSVQNDSLTIAFLTALGVCTSAGLFYLYYIKNPELTNLKQSIEEGTMLYHKLLLLNEKVQELALEEMETTASLPEAPKVKVYGR